jgi:hypothetical protein
MTKAVALLSISIDMINIGRYRSILIIIDPAVIGGEDAFDISTNHSMEHNSFTSLSYTSNFYIGKRVRGFKLGYLPEGTGTETAFTELN